MPDALGWSMAITGHDHDSRIAVLSHSLLGSPPSLILASARQAQLRFLPLCGLHTLTLVTGLGFQLLMPGLGGEVPGRGVRPQNGDGRTHLD